MVAIVDAVAGAPIPVAAPGTGDGVVISPTGSFSSSAFCAAGSGIAATSTIYLTNPTERAVPAMVTSIGQANRAGAVPTVRKAVSVPPRATLAVNPAAGLPSGDTASLITFAGGGVVANQVVSGADGWSTAPCASRTSPTWAFAGGSTSPGNTLSLSLLNPTATATVVNVTFLTPTGLVTPQAYQGLTVPAGQLLVENIGAYVQNTPTIATFVNAQAGSLVSNEFQQKSSGPSSGLSLRLGSPGLSDIWRFAQTTAPRGSIVDFTLANPGSGPVTATFTLGLPSGSVVPRSVVVPPQGVMVLSAAGAAGLPQQTPYSTTVTSSGGLVVGRSVEASAGSAPPAWGSSSGTVTLARRWLVPGPGTTASPGTAKATIDSLAVANPGPSTARVDVTRLDGSHRVNQFTVGPHQLMVLGSSQVGGLDVLVVSSSTPIDVEEDSGPAGTPGVVSSTGFPYLGS